MMQSFENATFEAPVMTAPSTLMTPTLPPVVEDFDPYVESLAFTLPESDADADMTLRDLMDGSGVQVEVNGRLVVTLMGCTADELPEGCLTFEFED